MEHTHKHYRGLSDAEVSESRRIHGDNTITPPEREPLWRQFLKKFTDPIIVILLVALALSVAVAFYQYIVLSYESDVFLEPAGILASVILATVVGFCFEVSAERKFEILNKVDDDTPVKVIRNGHVSQIAKHEVVVGDIVVLGTGEEVPADGVLLDAVSMQADESTLTGEPVAVKSADPTECDKEATYPADHLMRGTTVMDGHGTMRVTAVGDATEYGKVYEGARIDNSVETPLSGQLRRLAGMITRGSYAVAALIAVGRMATYIHAGAGFEWLDFGNYLLSTAMIAITVIVVAVPEGLPMSVTLSLALSMKRMLSANNLVRKMHACETMGAVTVICTDKTGTLTRNQMRINDTCFWGYDDDIVTEGLAVNSTAFLDLSDPAAPKVLGNPTEGALLLWLHGRGVDYTGLRERAGIERQLTFSTERKYMATVVGSSGGERILYVKGAPEIVMSLCDSVRTADGQLPVDSMRGEIDECLAGYQSRAMRTLGFAFRILDEGDSGIEGEAITVPLTLSGIAAISDPVREEVPDAIRECMDAGIDVKIVTGDTPGTAREIGRRIGLLGDVADGSECIAGPELAAMSDEELQERAARLKIVSRARPLDKRRLVAALQRSGHVVAVTGDGTNDAPALKAAQVGLSMGDGTAVAKEASDITITDNSFGSISRAVMWGRSLYKNIQRFILFQMTINVAACLIVLISSFLGTESPLTVTQMLWVNLIMDTFAALALASLPPDAHVMRERPRGPRDYIITPVMGRYIITVGLSFVVLLFGLLQYFKHNDITSLTQMTLGGMAAGYFDFTPAPHGLSPYELSLFFTVFVMMQFWNMFNAKAFATGRSAFYRLGESTGFLITVSAILIGQWAIVTFGGRMFGVTPLALSDWAIIVGATSVVLWAGEILRIFTERR
ncbi:MAG: calcium-translocating P-type ATPase, PMCA-type [Rikenellaceae bacterium]|nr:calcium-translocating P-type ATPase, PMCA-type [Rikenellaceae bacterium]